MKKILLINVFIITSLFCFDVKTVEPEEFLKDKDLEIKARNITKNIRCLVCQNQSIDDSNAPLAKDLRILVRNKIKDGYNDSDIYKFLTDRYGDFILLKPPLKSSTLLLWFLPLVFFIIGLFILIRNNKKSKENSV